MGLTLKGSLAGQIIAAMTRWSYQDDTSDDIDQVTVSFMASQFSSLPPFGTEYQVLIHGVSRGAGWKIIGSSINEHNLMTIKLSTVEKYGLVKTKKTTSYVQKTILEIVTDVIAPCGYSVSVDEKLAHLKLDAFRKDETAGDFLNRLAKDHAAISKPMNGVWHFKLKHDKTTSSGKAKPTIHINKTIPKVSIELSESAHTKFKGVKVSYYDIDKGGLVDVTRGLEPYDIKGTVMQEEAEAILDTYEKQHKNNAQSISVVIPTSDPTVGMAFAQGALEVDYGRFIKGSFIIDSVSMNERTTTIKGTRPND